MTRENPRIGLMLQDRQTSIVSDVDALRQPDFIREPGLPDDKKCPFGEACDGLQFHLHPFVVRFIDLELAGEFGKIFASEARGS